MNIKNTNQSTLLIYYSQDHISTLANGNQLVEFGTYTRSDGSKGNVGEVTGNLADNQAATGLLKCFGRMGRAS